ncbi:MAG: iron-containing alcohol dehydrogenase [Litorilinea sp.]
MKPAREYDIRYGNQLVQGESAGWSRYIVISTPTAWQTAEPFFTVKPVAVGMNQWLDRTHLEEIADSLPNDVDMVVGVGGGRALDHAKYVGFRKGLPVVLVPTIVSTGAIIHGNCGNWTGRLMNGFVCEIDPEYVLVDYELVRLAPQRLNTAGIGDVLCGYAGLSEWRHATQLGIEPPFDEELARTTIEHHAYIVENFPATFDSEGALTDASVRFIMEAVQQRDDKMLRHPSAPSADHAFCFALEYANDRLWIHGEETALGAVIIAWHSEQKPEVLVDWLDRCKVHFRPRQMGISKQELQRCLEILPKWIEDAPGGRNANSILCHTPLVGPRFEACWEWLENC